MFFSTSPIKLLRKIRAVTLTVSVLGIVLSGYSIYVHQRKEANKDYKAFCDISEEVSCSKVFTSRWGKGFGILGSLLGEDSPAVLANGFYGIAFYLFVIALGEIQSVTAANIQKYGVLLTNLLSVYLGYILLFVLKDKCVVCFSIYAINFLIAVMCFLRVHYVVALKSKKKGNKSASNQNAKQTTGKKNQQNANKNNNNQNANTNKNNNIQNANKSNQQQNADKSNQISKKKEKKGQKQNAEPVVNHQNAVSSKKKPEQIKNAQNNIKNRQNQNQSKKNPQNAVHQNASNKQSSSNKNNAANPNKHSKKKNN